MLIFHFHFSLINFFIIHKRRKMYISMQILTVHILFLSWVSIKTLRCFSHFSNCLNKIIPKFMCGNGSDLFRILSSSKDQRRSLFECIFLPAVIVYLLLCLISNNGWGFKKQRWLITCQKVFIFNMYFVIIGSKLPRYC